MGKKDLNKNQIKRDNMSELKKPRKSFFYFFKEGLLETIILIQVLAITTTTVLTIYGKFGHLAGDLASIWGHSFFISNSLGFSIKFLGAVAYWLFYRRFSHLRFFSIMIWLPVVLLGSFLGSEIAFYLVRNIFGTRYPTFSDPLYIAYLGGNVILGLMLFVFAAFYFYVKKKLERKTIEFQQALHLRTKSQLSALQAKINPHFLFNTLNAILGELSTDPKKVEKMILNLSGIYHKILKLPEDAEITLQDEIKLVKEYLEIEKMRMGDRLTYRVDLDSNLAKAKVPPLLIEPLVENAIIHGLSPKPEGGEIKIEAIEDSGIIKISVADNGVGKKEVDSKKGYGLYSIQERLSLTYGEKARFNIARLPFGGTVVNMEFPLER
jgi:two-component sensor histidine kinase